MLRISITKMERLVWHEIPHQGAFDRPASTLRSGYCKSYSGRCVEIAALAAERDQMLQTLFHPNGGEGLQAFVDKRAPRFR